MRKAARADMAFVRRLMAAALLIAAGTHAGGAEDLAALLGVVQRNRYLERVRSIWDLLGHRDRRWLLNAEDMVQGVRAALATYREKPTAPPLAPPPPPPPEVCSLLAFRRREVRHA